MSRSFFLDTNIFFSYADPQRYWHTSAQDFYVEDYEKYSGKRVEEESKKVIKRINNFLINMTIHIGNGGDIKSFLDHNVKNRNDKKYFKDILNQNQHLSDDELIEQFRARNLLMRVGVNEAFSRLDHPLISKSQDLHLEQPLRGNIDNISDVKIFVDAVCWCMNNSFLSFLSCDFTDFITNRPAICSCVCRVFMIDLDSLPLEIVHLGEL